MRVAAGELDEDLKRERFFARVWVPTFIALQLVALWAIGSIEPEGFDRCTAAPTAEEQRVQIVVAVFSLVLPLAGALIWLRWRYVPRCVVLLVLPALVWLVLLRPDAGSCGPVT